MKRKMTRMMNEDVLGKCENGEIMVNLTLLWEKHQQEDDFAEEFGLTYTHEILHLVLEPFCKKGMIKIVAEEKIVRTMLEEEWNSKLEKDYEADEA